MPKPVRVLYEDDFVAAFDKPPGLLVIPSPEEDNHTLVDIVNIRFPVGQRSKWHPCHRLDRDTSGIILFAKGKKNQKLVMQEFQNRSVTKKYIAFVRGRIHKKHGQIKSRIKDFHQKRFAKYSRAKLAITQYKVKSARKYFSVIEICPITGRTNQIRIHFSDIGHPLLGERIYAFGRDFPLNFRRLALHASELSFKHPVFRRFLQITSELPEDMQKFLGKHK